MNSFKDIKDRGHLILAYKEKYLKYKTIDLDYKNKLIIIDIYEYINNYPKNKNNSVCYINIFPYQREILNIKTVEDNLLYLILIKSKLKQKKRFIIIFNFHLDSKFYNKSFFILI